MTSITMTVRLDDQLKVRLEKLAEVTHRSKSFLAAEAISKYLEIQEWQLSEIKTGISEADSGQLVDHSTIASHWEKKRANSMDEGR
ncbi:MAG: CopG family ribbon-helix-helix protein [Proteobacteria bacterium]|nr:CopG family ribbon-helix-helix protein [Pseudomonadota bacterium]